MRAILCVTLSSLLVACSSTATTSILHARGGTFIAVQQGDRFWESQDRLNAQIRAEADKFCASRGQDAQVLNIRRAAVEDRPGATAETEAHFKCVARHS